MKSNDEWRLEDVLIQNNSEQNRTKLENFEPISFQSCLERKRGSEEETFGEKRILKRRDTGTESGREGE